MTKIYKIANWNVERPKSNTKKTNLALNKIKEIDANIFVLTETSNAIDLAPNYQSLKSKNNKRNPDEQWIAIWSKWKIIKKIDTFDSFRTVCALIETPFDKIIIYGTIIPYHNAGNDIRYGKLAYKMWQMHKEDIARQGKDWQRIMSKHNDIPFFVIGDYNQTRDNLPRGYGTKEAREILSQQLDNNDLTCVTGIDFASTNQLNEDPKKKRVRRNIDHISVSKKWLNNLKRYKINAWDNFTEDGYFMSDHNGVLIEFEISK